jgi:enoyl-CoA hydratase
MTAITDKILSEKSDGIGWLTFNNPARRNAVSMEMWQAIAEVLADFDADPEVRVVVMRGAGDKAFVSGADISQFEDKRKNAEQEALYSKANEAGRRAFDALRKPMIAMIRGFCIGGGVRVALSADLRIAADDAVFAIPAARLGLGYAFESIVKLVNLLGPTTTKDLLFTGRRMDAQEALRLGLVSKVVPVDALEEEVRSYARTIAENAPLTIRAAKIGVDQAMMDADRRDMKLVESSLQDCFNSEDFQNGRRAFMEKRKPVFAGR